MKKGNVELLLKGISQMEWKKNMEEAGMDMLPLTKDQLSLMRVAFELGFNSGSNSFYELSKDIYNTDVDVFEKLFDEED